MFRLGVRDNDKENGRDIHQFSTGHLLQHSLDRAIQYAIRYSFTELLQRTVNLTTFMWRKHSYSCIEKAHIDFTHLKILSELSSILEWKLATYILKCFQLQAPWKPLPSLCDWRECAISHGLTSDKHLVNKTRMDIIKQDLLLKISKDWSRQWTESTSFVIATAIAVR